MHNNRLLVGGLITETGYRVLSDGLCWAQHVLRDVGRVHGGWGTRTEAEVDPDRNRGVSCPRGRASGERLLLSR